MQPPYEMATNTNTLYDQEQNLTIDNGPSSILHTPNHIHHPILQHYHYSQSPHNTQQQNQGWKEQCHQEYQHFYQSHQHDYSHKFQPHQQTHSLGDNIVNRYVECEGSTAAVSFWKAFNNTIISDATEKQQHERYLVPDNNFGELEAVYKYKLGRNHQAPFIEEHDDSKRKAKKKRRKKRLKEEMSLMNAFFKRLTKSVVNHQEVLQKKLLEVIERMEKERKEREEKWRREENEIYEREAIVKERERDLAKERESSIVSSIEKITGRRFNMCVTMPSSSSS
ncbi:unnamed protein product [Trifolium pratense]|uniref:Uncharacterized protein n=1 Tax=Trifolium pratense TaxID=57577 RepID=A0ACB0JJV7_TRIPR|nr:unnamed protein product [Trifolium pratense]